jgi:DSBA-like thioredoxin domain
VQSGSVDESPAPAPLPLDDDDVFGAEDAAARLAERVARVPARAGAGRLEPPLSATRDRFDGPVTEAAALVVFGAHATPFSRPLGRVLTAAREEHLVAWRHFPDPAAHPRAPIFALAAEAAAAHGKFWALTRALLGLRHFDPTDLHDALLRAGLDPERTLDAMRSSVGADRIVDDVASARASGVASSPALFVNGERYRGDLDPAAVCAALARAR